VVCNWLNVGCDQRLVQRGNVNDVIDAELGLTFEDIRNSLLVLDVIKIENVVGPFLRNHLGFVKKEE